MRIAVIPARGGSVRVPRKNLKSFHGKPIIAYSIETAQKSNRFDRVIVSTDDEEIAEVSRQYGAEVLMRPGGYDGVGTQSIGKLVVSQLMDLESVPRFLCVIYATCPMLKVDDIDAGWVVMHERYPCYAMSVGANPLRDAGMFYWGEGWAFLTDFPLIGPRTAMVPVPDERVMDINTPADWEEAERMYARMKHEEARCAASS